MAEFLIVDDNEDIATLLQLLLEGAGHRVRVAHNGEQGLAELEAGLPDVVLLDVEMPVLDGPGLAYQMFVSNCGKENLPVVLASAVADLPEVAQRVGTPYSIAKPFDPEALLALVERALKERRLPRPPL